MTPFIVFIAVNGKWGTWGDWSSCTTTCDGGLIIRYRPCDNPPPENAGLYCLGRGYEKESCSTLACPGMPFFHINSFSY